MKENGFEDEGELQEFVEDNLPEIFGLQFIADQFRLEAEGRDCFLDTLAYDEERNTFVVIEYKNVASAGLIEQGVAYQKAVRENEEACIREYNWKHKGDKQIEEKDIDWKSLRIILISPELTPHQKLGFKFFKEKGFEFWKFVFESNEILFTPHRPENSVSIKRPRKSSWVSKEVSVGSQYLKMTSKCADIWKELRKKFPKSEYPGTEFKVPESGYIGFYKGSKVVCYLNLKRKGFRVDILRGYRGFKGATENLFTIKDAGVGLKGGGDGYYSWNISDKKKVSHTADLIKQKYDWLP